MYLFFTQIGNNFLVNFMSEKNCYYSTQTRGLDLRVNPYNIIYTNQIKMLIYRDKNLRKNSRPTNCINAFSFQKKAIAIESDDKSIFAFHGHFMFYFGPVTLSTTRPLSRPLQCLKAFLRTDDHDSQNC